jgi:hypothetical protein
MGLSHRFRRTKNLSIKNVIFDCLPSRGRPLDTSEVGVRSGKEN